MSDQPVEELRTDLDGCQDTIATRDMQIKSAQDVLREALEGIPGWRQRAREVLGLVDERQCPICHHWYDRHRSGTGRTCGRPSCRRAYRNRRQRHGGRGEAPEHE